MSATRACIIDTETTGLDPETDRIIEIAAVEIVDLKITGREIRRRVNPDGVQIQWLSYLVHGIKNEDLAGEPLFRDVWPEICDFIGTSRLIAHNAPFDIRFIAAECRRAQLPDLTETVPVEDSITLAKRLWPGKSPSLDNVCRRLNISLESRKKHHDALLDCQLLADAYCRMRVLSETPRIQASFLDVLLAETADTDRTPIKIPALRVPEIIA
ncbi:MAG: DNA polymerase III subunit epsilon [Hyphomicrobiales bacterium]|nr:DNA polymerase III subunit epsilon [Hyphomicrobiales bacterium]